MIVTPKEIPSMKYAQTHAGAKKLTGQLQNWEIELQCL